MAPKFKHYVAEMYDQHKELFDEFDDVHARYVLDRAENQDQFNHRGADVLRVIEEWENKLCYRMEKGKHSAHSHRLADKFRQVIRKRYSLIDFVGVTVRSKPTKPDFDIPRINLT